MSVHVAKKDGSSKTFRPRGSSSVTKLSCVTDEDPPIVHYTTYMYYV